MAERAVTVVVEAPAGYEPERRYILDVVLGGRLGLAWRLVPREGPEVRIAPEGEADGRHVTMPDVLFATPPAAWLMPASLPPAPLRWRPAGSGTDERLPVLYGRGDADGELLRAGPAGVELDVDVLGSCFFMLSRYEERVEPARDAHGRFPASASIARREGFLGLPVVDAYVELLGAALERLWPRLERRRPGTYEVALTHDVDDPLASLGRGPLKLVRQLGADALLRRDPALMARRVRSWIGRARGSYALDPYNTFDFLMQVSERHGLASAFYFIAAADTVAPTDPPYTLAHPWIHALMQRVHRRGHEVGFHAGFGTHRDPERTRLEFERLRDAAARAGVRQETWGGRQHYLLWENPTTWSNWDGAGLDYDTTLGYADHIGFRTGTCHPFPAFHLLERRPLRLRERPFQVMDGTLFQYMALSPEAALEQVLPLAAQCRRHGGTFSLLWHNSVLQTEREKRWYEELIAAVAARP